MPLDPTNSLMLYDVGTDGVAAREVAPSGPRTHIVALLPEHRRQLSAILDYVRERSDAYDAQQGPALRVVKGGAS